MNRCFLHRRALVFSATLSILVKDKEIRTRKTAPIELDKDGACSLRTSVSKKLQVVALQRKIQKKKENHHQLAAHAMNKKYER